MLPGDRRGAASGHRRCRACAGAESLRRDRRRRRASISSAHRRYAAARRPRPARGRDFHVALAGDAAGGDDVGSIAPRTTPRRCCAARRDCCADAIARAAMSAPRRALPTCRAAALIAAAPRTRLAAAGRADRPPSAARTAHALGVGLAFGHAEADALKALAEIATAQGARWAAAGARPRSLLLGPLSETGGGAVSRGRTARLRDARRRSAPPHRRLSRRAGLRDRSDRGARARGRDRARRAACRRGRLTLHVSGCAKGCAHPAPAALTIVGTERGCGIVAQRHGARDAVDLSRSKPARRRARAHEPSRSAEAVNA